MKSIVWQFGIWAFAHQFDNKFGILHSALELSFSTLLRIPHHILGRLTHFQTSLLQFSILFPVSQFEVIINL